MAVTLRPEEGSSLASTLWFLPWLPLRNRRNNNFLDNETARCPAKNTDSKVRHSWFWILVPFMAKILKLVAKQPRNLDGFATLYVLKVNSEIRCSRAREFSLAAQQMARVAAWYKLPCIQVLGCGLRDPEAAAHTVDCTPAEELSVYSKQSTSQPLSQEASNLLDWLQSGSGSQDD